jgi:hypothetical protein
VTRTTTIQLVAEQSQNLNRIKKLDFCFPLKEINALKLQLKTEKTASSQKRKAESILSTEIHEVI